MTRFNFEVYGSANMQGIVAALDRLVSGSASRIGRLQRELAQAPRAAAAGGATGGPRGIDVERTLLGVQAFGESELRRRTRAGEISIAQFRSDLRAFRETMAAARRQLSAELGRVVPEPPRAQVVAARRVTETRRASAQARPRDEQTGRFQPPSDDLARMEREQSQRARRDSARLARELSAKARQQQAAARQLAADQEALTEAAAPLDTARLARNRALRARRAQADRRRRQEDDQEEERQSRARTREVAQEATTRYFDSSVSAGGPQRSGGRGPRPKILDDDQVKALRDLVQHYGDSPELRDLLSQVERVAGTQRYVGQRVELAREKGIASYDVAARAAGRPTTGDLAAVLSQTRRKRNIDEQRDAAALANADEDLIEATGQLAASKRRFRLAYERVQLDAASPRDEAENVRRRREFRQDVRAVDQGIPEARHGTAEERAERDNLLAVHDRTEKHRRAARAAERTAKAEGELTASEQRLADAQAQEIAAAARQAVADRRRTQAVNAQAQAILRGRGPEGTAGLALTGSERGTFFQRVQAGVAARQGGGVRLPTEFQTGRQFLESKALTTAGFALSGAILYGGINSIQQLISEAEGLEKVLNQVEAQFEAIGQGDQFADFRREILQISRETGQAGSDVAFVAFQMKGAFGDTTRAITETSAAIKIAKVTGLELTEVVDSLTASAITFDTTIEDVGDIALSLQEKTGVLARELIKGLADIAPVAEEVGISAQQAGALIATANQSSGRSGAALAEAFGRILPALSAQGVGIASLYRENKLLAGSYDEVVDAVGRGDVGTILTRLITDWNKLTQAQKDQVLLTVGSRREAQTLAAVLTNQAAYVEALGASYDGTGKLASYFAKLQDTVAQRVDQLKAKFTQLGEALFKAGLADFLKDIVAIGGGAVSILTELANVLSTVLGSFGGLGAKIIAFTLALKALQSLGGIGTRAIRRTGLNNIGQFLRRGEVAAVDDLDPLGGFATTRPTATTTVAGRAARFSRARAAGSAAVGLVSGALPVLGLAGLGALENIRTEAEAQAADFAEKIKDRIKYSNETLARLAAGDDSLYDTIRAGLTGQPTKPQQAQREQRRRDLGLASDRIKLLYGRRAGIFTGSDDPGISREQLSEAVGTGLDSQGRLRNAEQYAAQQLLKRRVLDRRGLNPGDVIGGLLSGNAPRSPDATIDARRITAEELTELQKLADAGVEGADLVVKAVLAVRGASADGLQRIEDAVKRGRAKRTEVQKLKDLEIPEDGSQPQASLDVDTLVQAVAAGEASVFDLLDRTASEIETIQDALKRGPNAGFSKLLARFQRIYNEAYGSTVIRLVKSQVDNLELAGKATPQAVIRVYQDALPKLKARKDREEAAQAIKEAQQKILENRLALEDDAASRLRIAEAGIKIPDASRIVELEGNLADLSDTWHEFLEAVYGDNVEAAAAATTTLATALVNDASAGAATAVALIDKQIAALKAQAPKAPAPILGASVLTKAQRDAEAARIQRIKDLEAARGKYSNIKPLETPAGTIPIPAGTAGPDEQDLAQYRRQKEDADRALRDALAEYEKLLRAADPVAVAELIISQAEAEASLAAKTSDAVDDIQAATLRLQGERQLADAMAEVFDAQRELAQTVAELAGDTVKAAQIGADLVQEHLKRMIAEVVAAGGNPDRNAEVQRLKGQALRAQANVRDTDLQKRIGDIDFATQMEQVTTQQAIAQLEALLQIPNITAEQTRDLLLKIKSLRDSVGRDLSFNIPSEIRLPTLYEVRRLGPVERLGTASTYTDNRQINVEFTVNTDEEYESAINRFLEVVDRPPVYGTAPRTYP